MDLPTIYHWSGRSLKLCVRVSPVTGMILEDAPALAGAGEERVSRVVGRDDLEARSFFELRGEGTVVFVAEAGF